MMTVSILVSKKLVRLCDCCGMVLISGAQKKEIMYLFIVYNHIFDTRFKV